MTVVAPVCGRHLVTRGRVSRVFVVAIHQCRLFNGERGFFTFSTISLYVAKNICFRHTQNDQLISLPRPGPEAAGNRRASGHRGHRVFPLVRAVVGKAQRVRKQKTDRNDALLLLKLLLENRFPQIWVPSPENRGLWQLLWHRHRLVQMRTRIMNQLQAIAMNEGKRWKKKLNGHEAGNGGHSQGTPTAHRLLFYSERCPIAMFTRHNFGLHGWGGVRIEPIRLRRV